MASVQLVDVAFTRAGDKGDISDVTVFAPDAEIYELIVAQVTAERVKQLYGAMVTGPVTRYEVPNVLAVKFVLEGALAGGGPSSLRADNLGKAMGGAVLRLTLEVPGELLARIGDRPRPDRDPYRGQEWVVQ